jgi:hypothetical protein
LPVGPIESFAAAEALVASEACAPNTVVIAGFEWLTAAEYIELLTSSDNPEVMKQEHPDPNLFVIVA